MFYNILIIHNIAYSYILSANGKSCLD